MTEMKWDDGARYLVLRNCYSMYSIELHEFNMAGKNGRASTGTVTIFELLDTTVRRQVRAVCHISYTVSSRNAAVTDVGKQYGSVKSSQLEAPMNIKVKKDLSIAFSIPLHVYQVLGTVSTYMRKRCMLDGNARLCLLSLSHCLPPSRISLSLSLSEPCFDGSTSRASHILPKTSLLSRIALPALGSDKPPAHVVRSRDWALHGYAEQDSGTVPQHSKHGRVRLARLCSEPRSQTQAHSLAFPPV